jgi:Domain of Unknown Function (DUF1080)
MNPSILSRRWFWLTMIVCVSAPLVLDGHQATAHRADPITPRDKPIVLFDGRNLEHFYTWTRDTRYEDPRSIFNVARDRQRPVIHITGDGYGGLITKHEYTNYRLVAEYRWGERTWGDRRERARDSGVLVHGIGPDGGSTVQRQGGVSPWLTSVEFQIIEGGVGDLLVLPGTDASGQALEVGATVEIADRNGTMYWQKGGEPRRITRGRVNWFNKDPASTGALGFRGANDVDSPGQEWTRLECVADGDKLTFLVNGVIVNEASSVTPTAGKIQFQTEQAEIYFRTIELHPLKK